MENNTKKIKILVALAETAGDLFLITGTIKGLKKKFPNSNIFVACDPKFNNILEGNPDIRGILPFDESMYDYRAYGKWAMYDNVFDVVFCPAIVTQKIPHNWLNGKYAVALAKLYANACDVDLEPFYIKPVDVSRFNLPEKYITLQAKSGQDPKNYDLMKEVLSRIVGIPIVQLGGPNERINDDVIDLCGQTSFQEAAEIIKGADAHLGLDSVLMHFALHYDVPSVILFGGTLPEAAISHNQLHYSTTLMVVEPENRGPCLTSCHLIECAAKEMGYDKCINNIKPEDVVDKLGKLIGFQYIAPEIPVKLSSYIIVKDGNKYGFPYKECIEAALKVSDEVVVVDGGSKDYTIEDIDAMAQQDSRIKLHIHEWDMDSPTLFGDEKTYARQLCTGDWLLQLDADEIVQEPYPGAIKDIAKRYKSIDVIDLAQVNFYGDEQHIRIEDNCWKWRLSKNKPEIIHGVHGKARQIDMDTMKITMDKNISDACEYINADTLEIINHRPVFSPDFYRIHMTLRQTFLQNPQANNLEHLKSEYVTQLELNNKSFPVVFHYSWADLGRKKANGEFWDKTWHGQKKATHNITEDIHNRVEANATGNGDLIIEYSQHEKLSTL